MPQKQSIDEKPVDVNPVQSNPVQVNPVCENPVRRPRSTGKRTGIFSRAVLGAAFGACLVIAGGIGAAYAEDNEDSILPDQKFFRAILRGLGLRNGQEAGIDYKERPPLVVPPSRDLPQPQATASPAERNPAWPADYDEKQRKVTKKAESERKRYVWEDEVRQLSPQELAANKPAAPGPGGRVASVDLPGPQMSPAELGYKGGMFSDFFGIGNLFGAEKDEVATFTKEPPRTALTDPPSGYRTPSPAEPYGLRSSRDVRKKAVGDRQEEGALGK
jgi:hypothetical protein